jgi:hypothetical protein
MRCAVAFVYHVQEPQCGRTRHDEGNEGDSGLCVERHGEGREKDVVVKVQCLANRVE